MYPSIISLIDDSKEVAVYIDVNEEEENKEESTKTFELKIKSSDSGHNFLVNISSEKTRRNFTFEKYAAEYSEVHTPPPEFSF